MYIYTRYVHAYIHTYMHTYIQKYMHTHMYDVQHLYILLSAFLEGKACLAWLSNVEDSSGELGLSVTVSGSAAFRLAFRTCDFH